MMRTAKLCMMALALGACTAELDASGEPILDDEPYVSERVDGEEILRVISVEDEDVARALLRSGDTHLDVFVEALPGWELLDATVVVGHERMTVELEGAPTFDRDDGVSFTHVPVPLAKMDLAAGDGFKIGVYVTAREQVSDYTIPGSNAGIYRLRTDDAGLDADCCLE